MRLHNHKAFFIAAGASAILMLLGTNCSVTTRTGVIEHETPDNQNAQLPPASAGGFVTVHGESLKWEQVPVELSFDSSFPAKYKSACENAADTLNKAAGRIIVDLKDMPNDSNANLISWGKHQSGMPSNEAALTSWTRIDAKMIKADIDFDNRSAPFSLSPDLTQSDAESVCLHELGHFVGMLHVSDPSSVMYPFLDLGMKKRGFSSTDVANIQRVYGI